jgi:formylglycine-generating enzyme required for sulfatase activity
MHILLQTTLMLASLPILSSAALADHHGARKPGDSFADCEHCPEVVIVPAGKAVIGASLEEEERHGMSPVNRGKSIPLHEVAFARPFAMGKYPVTIAQFRQFVNETGYRASNSCFTQYYNDGHYIYEKARGYSWRAPGFAQEDDHPVVCVSAEDAEAYAEWLSKKTGHAYALPSEAQYEYALRAGTTTSYFWGEDRSRACEYSNQPDLDQARATNSPSGPDYRFQCSDGFAFTSPVGSFKPNPWGLYDMQGNIWEWTADCWNDNYEGAPTDGSAWKTGDCDARPSRGGSYGNAVHSAYAGVRAPRHASYNGHSWGFRIVRNDP